ncbi:DUF4340 domain-containing protein [Geopsychrobacter electrodiphilus]|uniref:DUF4340 domain-containing protein n=1 Tax=Geopsychrobacter electrodiphilus TaxID=225196 RepID=UPI00037E17E9|nr:DUF4340 domain-containing protein [Geopsychrobacter electrodiphilus]
MRTKLILLSLLLLAQIGLAFALGINSDHLKAFDATERLLALGNDTPDQLTIEGPEKQQLVLKKQDGHWTLPAHFGALADGAKIDGLLKSLTDLRRPWPVAENDSADKRFKVADDSFERRLTLRHGDKELGSLLLGSSPGFRKVHARVAGEKNVYDIPFSTYQVSLKAADWVDKGQLHLSDGQITGLTLADCQLVKKGKQLEVADLKDGEQTNAAKVTELLNKLANLTILDVAGKPEQSLAGPVVLNVALSLADGRQRSYQFIKGADGKDLQLQVSDQPWLFKVSPGLKDDLAAYTRATLVQPRPVAKPQAKDTPPAKE